MCYLRLFIKLLSVSRAFLFPAVIVICLAGTYTGDSSIFDVYLMTVFGLFGYLMKKFDFPVAPLIMGYILEPLLEISLVQALILNKDSVLPFFTRPLSLFFLLLAGFFMVRSFYPRKRSEAGKVRGT